MCLFLNRTLAGGLEVKRTISVLTIPLLHGAGSVGALGLCHSSYFSVLQLLALFLDKWQWLFLLCLSQVLPWVHCLP